MLSLLKQNLSEEKDADEKLTHLAETSLNLHALEHDTEKKSETASAFAKVATAGP